MQKRSSRRHFTFYGPKIISTRKRFDDDATDPLHHVRDEDAEAVSAHTVTTSDYVRAGSVRFARQTPAVEV